MNLDWSRFRLVLLDEVQRMWWVFAVGVLLAAFVKTFTWDKKIRKRLSHRGWGAVILATAIVFEAALVALVPLGLIRHYVGGRGPLPVLWGALAGIPLPLPQIAAVPLIRGLMEQGMQPAAAMALLIGGPVIGIPAIVPIPTVIQRSVIGVCLGVSLLTAPGFGYPFLALGLG